MKAPNRTINGRLVGCLLVVVLLLAVTIFSLRLLPGRASRQPVSERQTAKYTETARGPVSQVRSTIEETFDRVRKTTDSATIQQEFEDLRSILRTQSMVEVSLAIRDFLDSKADAPSRGGFKVGSDGFLLNAPSLRVFLLDELGRFDAVGAAASSKTIFGSMDSPDEWAVALRNYARDNTTPEGRLFLVEKLKTMLTYAPWIQDPSGGFLEAFDVAVYVGGPDLVPTLAGLVRAKDNQAAAHAAYLTLDRLTIADASTTLSFFYANPDSMEGREVTRANYFARADVRDSTQRQIVENYLRLPKITIVELETFAALYPNANYMLSPNLLTRTQTPDGEWLASRDAEALRVVEQWLEDLRFERVKPQLEIIQRRLASFVQQVGGSP